MLLPRRCRHLQYAQLSTKTAAMFACCNKDGDEVVEGGGKRLSRGGVSAVEDIRLLHNDGAALFAPGSVCYSYCVVCVSLIPENLAQFFGADGSAVSEAAMDSTGSLTSPEAEYCLGGRRGSESWRPLRMIFIYLLLALMLQSSSSAS